MSIIQIIILPLPLMLKKYSSILMMFTALAMLLGHDFIPHHHHDFEHFTVAHHHSDDHHHGDEDDGNGENEESDFGHLFSNFQHGDNGITFLSSHHITNTLSIHLSPSDAVLPDVFVFQNIIEFVRQNSPPYKEAYRNPQYLLPTGSRAPPTFIV